MKLRKMKHVSKVIILSLRSAMSFRCCVTSWSSCGSTSVTKTLILGEDSCQEFITGAENLKKSKIYTTKAKHLEITNNKKISISQKRPNDEPRGLFQDVHI